MLLERLQEGTATAGHEAALELSVLMPCLNEAETLGGLHARGPGRPRRGRRRRRGAGRRQRQHRRLAGDRRGGRARAWSRSPQRGYGSALAGGIAAARGRYVIMGDADDSYDFGELPRFLAGAARRRRPGHGQPLPAGGGRSSPAPCRGSTAGSATRSSPALGRLFFTAPVARLPLRPARLPPRRRSSACDLQAPAWSSPPRW